MIKLGPKTCWTGIGVGFGLGPLDVGLEVELSLRLGVDRVAIWKLGFDRCRAEKYQCCVLGLGLVSGNKGLVSGAVRLGFEIEIHPVYMMDQVVSEVVRVAV